MTAVILEALLGVGGFDVDRGVEMTMVNADIDVQKSDMAGGGGFIKLGAKELLFEVDLYISW